MRYKSTVHLEHLGGRELDLLVLLLRVDCLLKSGLQAATQPDDDPNIVELLSGIHRLLGLCRQLGPLDILSFPMRRLPSLGP